MSFRISEPESAPAEIQIVACDHLLRSLHQRCVAPGLANRAEPPAAADDFPGWLATCNEQVVAAIGATAEPDRTLSVTIPMFGSHAVRALRKYALLLLLRHARSAARQQALRGVHALLPCLPGGAVNQVLVDWYTDGGLPAVAVIAGMECGPLPGLDNEIAEDQIADGHYEFWYPNHLLRSSKGTTSPAVNDRGNLVRELIQECLVNSADLPPQCRPTVDDMLRMWRVRRAFVLCVWHGGLPAALMTLALPQSVSPANGQQELTIEYLGVASDQRGRGWGRRLLQAARGDIQNLARQVWRARFCDDQADVHSSIQQQEAGEPGPVETLRAFVDVTNVPAMRCYQASGFQRVDEYTLMYCAVSE